MPTELRRLMVTETPEVEAAVDAMLAARPDLTRPAALRELALLGAAHVETPERRRARVAELAGAFTGLYGDGYLAELRDEWPE